LHTSRYFLVHIETTPTFKAFVLDSEERAFANPKQCPHEFGMRKNVFSFLLKPAKNLV
jgi:hypothetical protein